MKPEILVYTAFTESSRNALDYACQLALNRGYTLLLAHNYDLPLHYTADAVALSSLQEQFENTEERLREELAYARQISPGLGIRHLLTSGRLAEQVAKLFRENAFDFIIVGAPESDGEFWGWNDSFVDKVNSMPAPVLIIPRTVSYQPVTEIGFASDYARLLSASQLGFIQRIMNQGPARLHIIHVSVPQLTNREQRLQHKAALETALASYQPVYASIVNGDVVATIIRYIREHAIQLLIVIPRRHGIWYSIFNQRYSRRLTRINHLPIITLQD